MRCPYQNRHLGLLLFGLATQSRQTLSAGVDVQDLARGTGAYRMAASGHYKTAWFENGKASAAPQTFFTKYLADVITAGVPGEPSALTLNAVFARARDNLTRDGKPEPTSTVTTQSPNETTNFNTDAGNLSKDCGPGARPTKYAVSPH